MVSLYLSYMGEDEDSPKKESGVDEGMKSHLLIMNGIGVVIKIYQIHICFNKKSEFVIKILRFL